MLEAFRDWITECWQRRPRHQPCDVCGRNVWVFGESAALVCDEWCEREFKSNGGVPF